MLWSTRKRKHKALRFVVYSQWHDCHPKKSPDWKKETHLLTGCPSKNKSRCRTQWVGTNCLRKTRWLIQAVSGLLQLLWRQLLELCWLLRKPLSALEGSSQKRSRTGDSRCGTGYGITGVGTYSLVLPQTVDPCSSSNTWQTLPGTPAKNIMK